MKSPDNSPARAGQGPGKDAGLVRKVMMSVPLGWQLSALYTLLLAVPLSLVGVLVYRTQQDFLAQDAASRLEQAATRIMAQQPGNGGGGPSGPAGGRTGNPSGQGQGQGSENEGPDPHFDDNKLHLDVLLRSLRGPDITVALLNTQGKVITSTLALNVNNAGLVDPVTPEQAAVATAGDKAVHWMAGHADGSRYVVVLMRINRTLSAEQATDVQLNDSTYLLEQSASLAAADVALGQLGNYLLFGVLGGTLAGLLLGTAFTRGLLRPLDRVADTAEAIAGGDLQRRLQLPEGRNEVARLGTAFDNMVGRLVATLEAQRRFVADASHELRTPLTSLKGLAEILMIGAHGNDSRVIEQSAGAINGELERLIRLVTDLLTLSRLDSAGDNTVPPARRTLMDVCATLQAVATQMEPLAEARGIDFSCRCAGSMWISGDPGQLKQVLLNLLDNALRYTPPGGQITLGGTRDAATARIEVRDTGAGIAAQDLPHIFERFYRGDTSRSRATGNSGLGLSIARTIIEAHSGKINVESTPGSGTCFTITLPLEGSPGTREEAAEAVARWPH